MSAGMREKRIRNNLSADGMIRTLRSGFNKIKDHRLRKGTISITNALMSGFAVFSLKDPSLLAFNDRSAINENLQQIYQITNVPSDTQMRTILDAIDPYVISESYKEIFRSAQRGKLLEKYVFLNNCYLVSIDGTNYFSSKEVHCESCLEKTNSKTGEITYQHQMLAATIIHPDIREVIPLMPEPIIKQDGDNKNDCERNASKRFFDKLRKDHPILPIIIVEDGLASNAPHIAELIKHKLHFILGVKDGDHKFLFNHIECAAKNELTTEITIEQDDAAFRIRFINGVPLNESNQDTKVNFIECWETKKGNTLYFSWVTDIEITKENAFLIMRGGRARWKIENETFNTLKNQGYNFEHNFGHGDKNLSVVFASLMMLAFLVDQIQQLACPLFRAVYDKCKHNKRSLWYKMRSLFECLEFDSMESIFKAMLYGYKIKGTIVINSPT